MTAIQHLQPLFQATVDGRLGQYMICNAWYVCMHGPDLQHMLTAHADSAAVSKASKELLQHMPHDA